MDLPTDHNLMNKLSTTNVVLQSHQEELLHLADLAGIRCNEKVMKILIELLNEKVPPYNLYAMLKNVRKSDEAQKKVPKTDSSTSMK